MQQINKKKDPAQCRAFCHTSGGYSPPSTAGLSIRLYHIATNCDLVAISRN